MVTAVIRRNLRVHHAVAPVAEFQLAFRVRISISGPPPFRRRGEHAGELVAADLPARVVKPSFRGAAAAAVAPRVRGSSGTHGAAKDLW